MRIGFVYDLRDEYLAAGYSELDVAEFDSVSTIDEIEAALHRLGHVVVRVGRGQALAGRLVRGERFDLVFSIAEGLKGRSREAQVPALCELFDQPYAFSDPLTMAATRPTHLPDSMDMNVWPCSTSRPVRGTSTKTISCAIAWPNSVKPCVTTLPSTRAQP